MLQWRRVRWAAPLTLFLAGCSVDRTTPAAPGGVHPPGWADPTSSAFHAGWLEANGFPLSQCQACHGDDYAGGAVGVSCTQAGCHTSGPPTSCTTCHGANGTPRPQTGAHWDHLNFCDTCHVVPTTAQVQEHASADASTIVQFSGLAVQGGAQPSFDATNMQCANVYCHFGKPTPAWTSPTPIPCDGCHGAPPADHAAWSRLATSDISSCLTCHPGFTDPRHVNGVVDITISSCTTCHGSEGHANPPVSLSGSTDPTTRGVGAHDRHLNPSLPDRISEPVACSSCHPVPASITSPGHLDQPTQVTLPQAGAYDTANATCNVWCHFNRTPGPTWTDNSGAARQCDACHAFPPLVTRTGEPHPSVEGNLTACLTCHVFGPSTHVNGVVDFRAP